MFILKFDGDESTKAPQKDSGLHCATRFGLSAAGTQDTQSLQFTPTASKKTTHSKHIGCGCDDGHPFRHPRPYEEQPSDSANRTLRGEPSVRRSGEERRPDVPTLPSVIDSR